MKIKLAYTIEIVGDDHEGGEKFTIQEMLKLFKSAVYSLEYELNKREFYDENELPPFVLAVRTKKASMSAVDD